MRENSRNSCQRSLASTPFVSLQRSKKGEKLAKGRVVRFSTFCDLGRDGCEE